MRTLIRAIVPGLLLGVLLPTSCGGNDNNGPPPGENAGSACAAPSDCYRQLDGAALQGGPIVCLTKVTGGYCTHNCTTDSDCCAVQGECRTGFKQVCAPFENTGQMYCFLSCESTDVHSGYDPTTYCQTYANQYFGCRSTGGGSLNRQICSP